MFNSKTTTFFGSIALLSIVGLVGYLLYKNNKPKPQKNVLLLGGLDNRSGDLKLSDQQELLQQGLGTKYNVSSFRYNDISSLIENIEQSMAPMFIVLFSAGCKYSTKVATIMNDKGFDLSNLYVVEAYGSSDRTKSSVKGAVDLGVPSKNVLVGKYKSAGMGIVENATPTPECSPGHWCSLTEVGKIIQQK